MSKSKHFETLVIHGGQKLDSAFGAVMPPIYQTSTYAQDSPGKHKGYEYSRTHNPTRKALESAVASIEMAKHGFAFASGMAAIDAILKLLKPGDEVISVNDLYGGTYRIFTKMFQNFGIKFNFIDISETSSLESSITENTKLVWVETPTNPMLGVIDISEVATIVKKNNCLLAVDNTFATPYLQNPLLLGADIVVHSATKYLGGHSDVVLGVIALNDDLLAESLAFIQNSSGAVCGPFDSFLVLRGIKTLHLRMQRHCENGKIVAEFLKSHPKIERVYWPGFKEHPTYHIAKRQMKGFGGMISFITKGDDYKATISIVEKLKVFTLAESLGGVESLVGHPASMTHAGIPQEQRLKSGLSDSLIRLSVGVEAVEDLIDDLKQAIG